MADVTGANNERFDSRNNFAQPEGSMRIFREWENGIFRSLGVSAQLGGDFQLYGLDGEIVPIDGLTVHVGTYFSVDRKVGVDASSALGNRKGGYALASYDLNTLAPRLPIPISVHTQIDGRTIQDRPSDLVWTNGVSVKLLKDFVVLTADFEKVLEGPRPDQPLIRLQFSWPTNM